MNRESKKIQLSTAVAVAGLMMIIGFIGGTRKAELYNLVAPIFGLKKESSEINLSSVQNTYKKLVEKFDGNLDEQALISGASKGLVSAAGDDYTEYMTAEEAKEFNKSLSGDVGAGIGVEVGLRNNLPTVVRTLKDNPAIKAGIQAGDIISEVNDEDVSKMSISEVTNKIKGKAGTTVKLTILREGKKYNFNLTRATISNPSVEVEYIGELAIMRISRFDTETGSLAKKYAQEIRSKNISKIVLDLRGNGGGYVSAAQAVASLWLKKDDIIVTEKKGSVAVDEIKATGDNLLANTQTIVLADNSSASASEIVVGALKEHGAAQFYGVKTYGKGSVQDPININDGAILKVTIAKWYTPNGKNIDKEGIQPDKEVKVTLEQINSGQDPQLEAAKESLK